MDFLKVGEWEMHHVPPLAFAGLKVKLELGSFMVQASYFDLGL